MRPITSLLITVSLTAPLLFACGAEAPSGDLDPVAENSSPVMSYSFTDDSGKVHVQIKACDPTVPAGGVRNASCTPDAGYYPIGGGVEVVGQGYPGAMLTRSIRISSGWYGGAKDHDLPYGYALRPYVIGLKIDGLLRLDLLVHKTCVTSAPSHAPQVRANVPAGDILIGGGASTNASGNGQLLVISGPLQDVSGDYWFAMAKDHMVSDVATVTACALSLPAGRLCPFGVCAGTIDRVWDWSGPANVSSGYARQSQAVRPGFALTGIGAWGGYSGAGRMLTAMIPFADFPGHSAPGATAYNKDHEIASSGGLQTAAIGIRLR